jgi:hypothetical protein
MPTLVAISGKILDEYQATTQQLFNSGYRRLQNELTDLGVEKFSSETVIFNIPIVTNLDPSSSCWMSFSQFFDGTNYYTAPVLPSTLIIPLWLSERQNGTNLPFPPVNRPNMRNYMDGLPGNGKYIYNGAWEWRNETLYFPGALQAVDFRMRYRASYPPIVDNGSTPWFQQTVPILRCGDALAWWVCFEFATSRMADGDSSNATAQVAQTFKTEAQGTTELMVNQTVMKNQRNNVRQIPYGGRGRGLSSF